MKVIKAVCSPGKTGFFFDDQKAIKQGAKADGASYQGEPVTSGFKSIRQAGEAISVTFLLEDGQIAYGDCAAVQYSGAGGRDPLFLAKDFIPVIEKNIFPWIIGKDLNSFRTLSKELEDIQVDGKKLHTAIRYGVSQAILDAVAKAKHKLMCEIIAEEYHLTLNGKEVPIFTQSGDARYDNVDKMIMKEASVLPHGLINHVDSKLGKKGELLLEYVNWLKNRIGKLRTNPSYMPILHIDVYGTIGQAFGDTDYNAMANYLSTLAEAAKPFKLRIEGPMDVGDGQKQMEALSALTKLLDERKIPVEIVADEWCNTLEDIKYFADHRAGHMIQIKTPDLGGISNIV